ncbi:MAG: hypothetical protein ACREP7_15265, partial [Lysobacter sp.]
MSAAQPSPTASRTSLRPRKSPWPKRVAILVVLVAAAGVGWHFYSKRSAEEAAGAYRTAKVERGDIRVAISATGAL